MERFHIDADHAFALITRLSQDQNIKLHTIATQLIADATQPTAPRPHKAHLGRLTPPQPLGSSDYPPVLPHPVRN